MAAPINSPSKEKSSKNKGVSKKRKAVSNLNNDDEGENTAKRKCTEPEFTEIQFKVGLKDANTRFAVLDKFVEEAENFPELNNYDIIDHYCASSRECHELLALLEGSATDKRKQKEVCSIFAAIEIILVNVASRLPKHKHVGLALVRRILAEHVGLIFYMININNKSNQIKIAVKLMSAMVMQGGNAPRDVLKQIDLNSKTLHNLLDRRDMKDRMDVRTCMLHFMLSFLMVGDKEITIQILEAKGFLNGMFPGLIMDKLNVLEMVLPTLLEKVVKNPDVTKTLKVRLCNQAALTNLAKLYKWTGAKKWSSGDEQTGSEKYTEIVKREDCQEVAAMVHDLLLHLCCDFKLGINFFDKSYGMSGKSLNHLLTGFLKSLHEPFLSSHLSELVVRILKACPDQLVWYIPELRSALAPRSSNQWIAAMALLNKIYSAQPDAAPCMTLNDRVPVHKLVTMAVANLIPAKESFLQILAAVRHNDPVLQYEGLSFLLLVFKRVKATLEFSKMKTKLYSVAEMDTFASSLKDSIIKACPDVGWLLSCWSRAVKLVGASPGESVVNDAKLEDSTEKEAGDVDADDVDVDVDDVVKGFPVVSSADQLLTILQTMCEYQALFPETFSENFFNFSSLLEGLRTLAADDATSTHEVSLVQLHLLRLLAESNIRQNIWLRTSFSGRSTLYLLLEMVVTTHSNPQMISIATNLLQKLLVSTGVFEHTERELAIWLRHLPEFSILDPEVLPFVERIFSTVIKDPFSYTEKVFDSVTEGMTAAANTTKESTHITESILLMEEVDLTDTERSKQELEIPSQSDQCTRLPFSVLVPASLKLWKETMDGKDEQTTTGVRNYLCRVVHIVLHQQTDPMPLCLMLHKHEATWLDSSCFYWLKADALPVKKIKMSKKLTETDLAEATSLTNLLTVVFNAGDDAVLREDVQSRLKSLCTEVNLEDIADIVRKSLLYMHTRALHVLEDDCHVHAIAFYLDLLAELQKNLQDPTEIENTDTDEKVPDGGMECSSDEQQLVTTSVGDQFSNLQVTKPSRTDALKSLITLVAQHPDIERWFLFTKSNKGKDRKIGKRLRPIITSKCANIFGILPQTIVASMEGILEIYKTKTYDEFQMYMEGLVSGNVASSTLGDATEALVALLSILPWNNVIKAASYLGEVLEKIPDGLKVLLAVLKQIVSRMKEDPVLVSKVTDNLSLKTLSKLSSFACEGDSLELDNLLFDVILLCPLFAIGLNQKHFVQCLNSPPESAAHKMAAVVVSHSEASRCWFRHYWAELSKKEKNAMKWNLIDVSVQYVRCLLLDNLSGGKEMRQINKAYYNDLFEWIQSDLSGAEPDNDKKHALLTMLTTCSDNAVSCWSGYLSFVVGASVLSVGQARFIFTLCCAAEKVDTTLPVWGVCVGACLSTVNNLLAGKGKAQNNQALTEILIGLNKLFTVRKSDMEAIASIAHPLWSELVKAGLKHKYEDLHMLTLLTHLVRLVYSYQSDEVIIPAHVIYQMLMSHSRFLPIMLQEIPTRVKDALVNLLLTVAQQNNKSCCDSSAHITALLGAYGASLHKTDQKLLILMNMYQNTGLNMDQHKPFLFGPKGVEHHSVKKSLGASLRTRAESEQVMELFSPERLTRSALHFPLQRKLKCDSVVPPEDMASYEDVYDPCFILSLFSYMVQPGHIVNCFEFVQSGCLGYVLTSLSCHDKDLRGASYHVLTEFYHQAESSRFPAKDQIVYILQLLKDSVSEPNTKIVSVVTAFLARAVKMMITPDALLYSTINEFLLLKPAMDILNVPEFFKLFYSSDLSYKSDRSWILSLLVDGLRETADYRIFEKRYTFKQILSFYDSPLSDAYTQGQVLKVLLQAVRQYTVANDLIKYHGILTWINAAIGTSEASPEKQALLVEITDVLWNTMLASRTARTCNKSTPDEELTPKDDLDADIEPQKERSRRLPLAFTNEMLLVVQNLLRSMRFSDDVRVFNKLVACIGSILGHLKTTVSTMDCDLPPFRVRLKDTDILKLLLTWSSLIRKDDEVVNISQLLSGLGHSPQGTDVSVTNKTPRRHKANTEQVKEPGFVMDCEVEELSIKGILQVIIYWLPIEEDLLYAADCGNIAMEEVNVILYVAFWSLNECYRLFVDELQMMSDMLNWFKLWTLNRRSYLLRTSLASDTELSRALVSQLLTVYGLCTKSLSELRDISSNDNNSTCAGKMEVVKRTNICTTEILASVVDHVSNDNSIECQLRQNLNKKSFKTAWNALNVVKGNDRALGLFIQELWMDANKPSHFMTVVQASAV